jgi:hypothetical protein
MHGKPKVLTVVVWAAALFIAGSVLAAAVSAASWTPVFEAGWLVPVLVAVSMPRSARCRAE